MALIAAVAAGCSSTTKPVIGPIEFTSSTGASAPAISSLAVNGQAYMIASVTHDDQLLGITWTVNCGSAIPPSSGVIDTSCGTFSPVQTMSGPVPAYPTTGIVATYTAPADIPKGGTVVITASVTSEPSINSSVTLSIVAAKASAQPSGAASRAQASSPARPKSEGGIA